MEKLKPTQSGFLDSRLDSPRHLLVVLVKDLSCDNRSGNLEKSVRNIKISICNLLDSIDDFLDARHSLGDVHRSDTGKVEGLQGHLG